MYILPQNRKIQNQIYTPVWKDLAPIYGIYPCSEPRQNPGSRVGRFYPPANSLGKPWILDCDSLEWSAPPCELILESVSFWGVAPWNHKTSSSQFFASKTMKKIMRSHYPIALLFSLLCSNLWKIKEKVVEIGWKSYWTLLEQKGSIDFWEQGPITSQGLEAARSAWHHVHSAKVGRHPPLPQP